uniref:Uncharacterized protein n=1 Tax=Megaselia scalaris TaxID=36166 RepID=T1GLL5_MEGSC
MEIHQNKISASKYIWDDWRENYNPQYFQQSTFPRTFSAAAACCRIGFQSAALFKIYVFWICTSFLVSKQHICFPQCTKHSSGQKILIELFIFFA